MCRPVWRWVVSDNWHWNWLDHVTRIGSTFTFSSLLTFPVSDLLERGMSSGQAVRLLLSPPKRRALEERLAAEELASAPSVSQKGKDKDAKGSEKQKSKVQSVEPPISDDPDKDRESPKEKPAQPQSDWFNMVCYGMPNLVIT